ncbi:hypothetical protein OW763_14460 [Clostridium aestuarii]|uniref:Uncharacterized protein n=1 Tax=Clostridium aestuarii TaxID=338193 RepID=A0ABT4D2S9_9CLOT|nr:hypothetical protein [Clostridium aestuarii]MCY6485534.1 hypothetical protein [Clostridium aestuarii]
MKIYPRRLEDESIAYEEILKLRAVVEKFDTEYLGLFLLVKICCFDIIRVNVILY